MISIKKLRENTDLFQKGMRSKGDSTDLNLIIALDEKLRSLKTKSNAMRAERNSASDSIGVAKSQVKMPPWRYLKQESWVMN